MADPEWDPAFPKSTDEENALSKNGYEKGDDGTWRKPKNAEARKIMEDRATRAGEELAKAQDEDVRSNAIGTKILDDE